jgi:multiple sugar transport system substrate-binding protein
MVVKTAFISGPMYDPLYASLKTFHQRTGIDVEVCFQGDHPALNQHLREIPDIAYDLVSTHTKYAPSQLNLLAPLDDLLAQDDLTDFAPTVLELARVDGRLMALPRNIDVRLLHYRTDLIDAPPMTWDALLEIARQLTRPPGFYGFVFPGRESGLFGTFFELVEAGGAHLFPPDLIPQIENDGGRWALGLLRTLYADGIVSPEIVNWHYDRVHDQFRNGRAAMVGDWPGFYGAYRDRSASKVADSFRVVPYPKGPSGKARTYGGGHTFALTHQGAQNPEALALLRFLTAPEQQLTEAQRGSVPVRESVMTEIKAESTTGERERWETLEYVIREQIIIPPKFAQYPVVEDVLWTTVQGAIIGQLDIDSALHDMTARIRAIVRDEHVQ